MDSLPQRSSTYDITLLVSVTAVFVWSGISPNDRFTWLLEVFPVILGVPVLVYLYPRFRFTPLVITLIAVHAVILMVGASTPMRRCRSGSGWPGRFTLPGITTTASATLPRDLFLQ